MVEDDSFYSRFSIDDSLIFKVYGGDVFADGAAEVCDRGVVWVDCVGVEAGSVAEGRDEAGVVGARKSQHVAADGEALNFEYHFRQAAQALDVLAALLLAHLRPVLPNDDVRQHSLQPRSAIPSCALTCRRSF